LPASNRDEALFRLRDLTAALLDAVARAERPPSADVSQPPQGVGYEALLRYAQDTRLRSIGAHTAMCIEASIKALCALVGIPPERTHRVSDLLAVLPAEIGVRVQDLLEPLAVNRIRPDEDHPFDDIAMFSQVGAYPSEFAIVDPFALVPLLAQCAVHVASFTITKIGEGAATHPHMVAAVTAQRNLASHLDEHDLVTGERRCAS